ncbi:MAG: SDR family oxidoreductase [Chloroflexota bacterium]
MEYVLITGANRGIGLELTRQYIKHNSSVFVFATCRDPQSATELNTLAQDHTDRVEILKLDVTETEMINATCEQVSQRTDVLDVLINNAGVFFRRDEQRFGQVTTGIMMDTLRVNTVAPLMITQAFADHLRRSSKPRVINISSQLGSIERKRSGGQYAYCTSKAALNMVTRALAGDLGHDGVIAVTMHPGWVQTDMGGSAASLEAEESAQGMITVIDGLSTEDNGTFLSWDGSSLPW